MRVRRVTVALVVVLGLAGCGSDKDPSMPVVTGEKLDVAKSAIEDAGYNDDVNVDGGGLFGVVKESNWQVCKQSPKAGAAITGTPRLTVDRSCEEDSPEPTATPSATDSPPPSPEASETTEPVEDETLTPQNNKELAAILVGGECDDTVAQFATRYAERTITFNGSIADIALHGDNTTRYDILIAPGDKGPNTVTGAIFKFEDENLVSDLGLPDKNRPDSVSAGDRFRFVAQVGEYNPDLCILFMEPVSTIPR